MRISDWSSGVCSSELLAVVHVGCDVADDVRGRLEAVEFFSGHRIDRLQIALEGAVEDHVAGRREGAGPHREGLLLRPHDLTLGGIPGDEIAEVVAAGGGIHREGRPDVGLAGGVDRKSVVEGKSEAVRVVLGGRSLINTKTKYKLTT